jgi:hypothetical protein
MPDRIDVDDSLVIDSGGSLDELISKIEDAKKRISSIVAHSVRWEPLSSDSYEGYGIKIVWKRPETDSEYYSRKRHAESAHKAQLKYLEQQAALHGKKLVDK